MTSMRLRNSVSPAQASSRNWRRSAGSARLRAARNRDSSVTACLTRLLDQQEHQADEYGDADEDAENDPQGDLPLGSPEPGAVGVLRQLRVALPAGDGWWQPHAAMVEHLEQLPPGPGLLVEHGPELVRALEGRGGAADDFVLEPGGRVRGRGGHLFLLLFALAFQGPDGKGHDQQGRDDGRERRRRLVRPAPGRERRAGRERGMWRARERGRRWLRLLVLRARGLG